MLSGSELLSIVGSGTWTPPAGVTLKTVKFTIGNGGSPGGGSGPADGGKGGDSADKLLTTSIPTSFPYVVGAINGGASSVDYGAGTLTTSANFDNFYAGVAGGAHTTSNGGDGGRGGNNGGFGGSRGSKKSDGSPGQQATNGGGGGGGGGAGKNASNGGAGGAGSILVEWTGIGTINIKGGAILGGNYGVI